MSLTKSSGNMYKWVTHCHTPLGGECPHRCSYCSVDHIPFGRPEKYQGPLRLIEEELEVSYGCDKTIFIGHLTDLFAEAVPEHFIVRVLMHCQRYPFNRYVFQTKNPARYEEFLPLFPEDSILGTTIETNRFTLGISAAPLPVTRYKTILGLNYPRKFVTIEPILDFDVDILASWIAEIRPKFLNLGADSKNHQLPEPSIEKIEALVAELKKSGIELREKHNLERLRK